MFVFVLVKSRFSKYLCCFSFLFVYLQTYMVFFLQEDMIENEVKILRRVNHSNIIQLIAEQDTKNLLYLVVEYVKGDFNFM